MRPTELIAEAHSSHSSAFARRLLVTQKLPPRNLYESIGILSLLHDSSFHFSYLSSFVRKPFFRELPGLPKCEGGVNSAHLFPFFAERVISSERPDRFRALSYLNLEESADPFEILARSGGSRINDHLELLPFPFPVGSGWHSVTFFVHGVRHLDVISRNALDRLYPDVSLELDREPSNPESELALRVSHNGTPLGYVPHPLLNFVFSAVATDNYALTVVRRNSADAGFHQRLLVKLDYRPNRGDVPFFGVDLEEF